MFLPQLSLTPPQRLLKIGDREDWGEVNIKRAEAGESPARETSKIRPEKFHTDDVAATKCIWLLIARENSKRKNAYDTGPLERG